jgi:hypothetical protein
MAQGAEVAPEGLHVFLAERSEDEAGIDIVTRQDVVLVAQHTIAFVNHHRQRQFERLAVAPDLQRQPIAMLRGMEGGGGKHAIALERHVGVAADLEIAHLQQHIIRTHQLLGGGYRQQTVDARADAVAVQPEVTAVGRVLQRHDANAGHRKPLVAAILDVFEKVLHHRRRDEEPGVLQPRNPHERHPHNQVILQHRPTAVAGVDRGIGLNREKTAVADVNIVLELDAGDHAAGIGDLLAARGITVSHHRRTHFGGSGPNSSGSSLQRTVRPPLPTAPGRSRAR